MRKLATALGLGAMVAIPLSASADFEGATFGPASDTLKPMSKPWDLSLHVFVGKDTNVPLAPDETFFTSEKESPYGGFSATATYRVIDNRDWQVGVSGTAERMNFFESDLPPGAFATDETPSAYNFWVFNASVFADRNLSVAGKPATVGATYSYRQEGMRKVHAGGLDRHSLQLRGTVKPARDLTMAATINYATSDHEVEFPDPELDQRDGEHINVALSAIRKFNKGRQKASATYAFSKNKSDGRNFEYQGHKISARVETHVYGPVWAGFDVAYDMRDYEGFQSSWIPSPGRTDQDILTYGAQVLWPITSNITLDITVKHTDYDANIARFTTDRTQFGGGVTIRF